MGVQPLLTLNGAHWDYGGQRAIDGIHFHLVEGDCVALVGESGVGKSSLLRLLRHRLGGDCAWCPQEGALVNRLSAFHNIHAGALDRHGLIFNALNLLWPRASALEAVRPVARTLDIEDLLMRPVETLSGGQQQRVAVARAIHSRRAILLADEPVSALDPHQAHYLLETLRQDHRACVIALHDLDLALAVCNRIVGLSGGRIVIDAPTAGLKREDLADLFPHAA
ncbi:MAG: ATP-binding cassette domain-containing protein [Pseudomonadota bacterium]